VSSRESGQPDSNELDGGMGIMHSHIVDIGTTFALDFPGAVCSDTVAFGHIDSGGVGVFDSVRSGDINSVGVGDSDLVGAQEVNELGVEMIPSNCDGVANAIDPDR
jgi:hypothetical protein